VGLQESTFFVRLAKAILGFFFITHGLTLSQPASNPVTTHSQSPAAPSIGNLFSTPVENVRKALIISNQAYRFPGFPNARRDGLQVRDALARLGFEVTFVEDSSRTVLIETLRSFTRKLNEKSEAFVVYLGHGVQWRDRNFILPVDENITKEADIALYGVELSVLLQGLEKANPRMSVVVLDAAVRKPFGPDVAPVRPGLADVRAPTNTYVVFSAAPSRLVSERIKGQSIFVQQLIRALPEASSAIENMFKQVRDSVAQLSDSEQVPWDLSSLRETLVLERSVRFGVDERVTPSPQQLELLGMLTADRLFWDSVVETGRVRDYQTYLARFRNGQFVALARKRITELEARGGDIEDRGGGTIPTVTMADGARFSGRTRNGQPHGAGDLLMPNGDVFSGTFEEGTRVGTGRVAWGNGDLYVGTFKLNRPHGFGHLSFANGEQYTGHFEEGVLHGKGRYQSKDGSVYLGEFLRQARTGAGELSSADGSRWRGIFKDGALNGLGEAVLADGSRWQGYFKNGILEGQGEATLADGARLRGILKDGALHGPGEYFGKDGTKLAGEFVAGILEGVGKAELHDGSVLEGSFVKGLLTGEGRMRFGDGTRYQGSFVNGVPSGRGRLSFVSGHEYEGDVANGSPQGRGQYLIPGNSRLTGQFENGLAKGLARIEFEVSKQTYEGEVENSMPHGQGKYLFPDGAFHQGLFKTGLLNGPGLISNADGSRFEGSFVAGKLTGPGRYTLADKRVFEGVFSGEGTDAEGELIDTDGTRRAARIQGRRIVDASELANPQKP
jgi:hypothetical protein